MATYQQFGCGTRLMSHELADLSHIPRWFDSATVRKTVKAVLEARTSGPRCFRIMDWTISHGLGAQCLTTELRNRNMASQNRCTDERQRNPRSQLRSGAAVIPHSLCMPHELVESLESQVIIKSYNDILVTQ